MDNPYKDLKQYEGKELKYKNEFCEIFNVEYKHGRAKKLQLKKLRTYMNIEQVDRKIKINKIYDNETIEENLENKKFQYIRNKELLNQFYVSGDNIHKSGIYKIELNNIIYIGQTIDFYERFRQHFYSEKESGKLLRKGAIFSILELEDDLNKRLNKEKEYIKKYCDDKNYICINSDFNYNNCKKTKI